MSDINIELWFDDRPIRRKIIISSMEFEQLIINKEIISDEKEYLVGKCILVNEGDSIWYRVYCFLKGGLRSQEVVR